MFLLVAETANLFGALNELPLEGALWKTLIGQLHHHDWHGLHFWDLVQPFFMFIVGVAMAFSIAKRRERDQSWRQSLGHILYRCGVLLLLGVGLQCIYARELRWELWNVLSQLSVTILIAFLIVQWSVAAQVAVAFALILATEMAYRGCSIEDFDKPFVQGENFGTWMDTRLMGKASGGGWVAINCIPTAAHTIWGVLAGKLLLGPRSPRSKVVMLLACGLVLMFSGYGLNWLNITPIIKRISTSSFVLASGGWCLVVLALLYWLVDILGFRRWGFLFVVIGMNPIFIYLFSETIGRQWFNGTVTIFARGALRPFEVSEATLAVVSALAALGLYWLLCYWLFNRKILIKI